MGFLHSIKMETTLDGNVCMLDPCTLVDTKYKLHYVCKVGAI
jgi:hypothetical protein